MNYFLIFSLCAVTTSLTRAEATYEDLKKLGASCHPRDTCAEARLDDSPGISDRYACSCDRLCSQYGTCCIDAPYKNSSLPGVTPRCRAVDDTSASQGFFMVDRCGEFDPVWQSICEEEWKGEDNVLKIAPVTSLFSSLTYKNYFCLRCHERTHDFLFWNLELLGHQGVVVTGRGNFGVEYDPDRQTWMAKGENDSSVPVNLRFRIPDGIRSAAVPCQPELISGCSEGWSDEVVRDRCSAYTALVYVEKEVETLQYRNAHCALCSFERKEDVVCRRHETTVHSRKKTFSFVHLIDINRSDGDRVGEARKCGDNFVWDPYGEVCRKLGCAIPGYVIKDGKCGPP